MADEIKDGRGNPLALLSTAPPRQKDDVEKRQQDHPYEDAGDEVRVDKEVSPLPPGTGLVTCPLVWKDKP